MFLVVMSLVVTQSNNLCIRSFVVFVLQAEDGIRYLVRSRGLGDVYKRQIEMNFTPKFSAGTILRSRGGGIWSRPIIIGTFGPVSYTHLTLPTSALV